MRICFPEQGSTKVENQDFCFPNVPFHSSRPCSESCWPHSKFPSVWTMRRELKVQSLAAAWDIWIRQSRDYMSQWNAPVVSTMSLDKRMQEDNTFTQNTLSKAAHQTKTDRDTWNEGQRPKHAKDCEFLLQCVCLRICRLFSEWDCPSRRKVHIWISRYECQDLNGQFFSQNKNVRLCS